MKKISLSLLILISLLFAAVAAETEFQPTKKQIEIIVPYPAGGATDVVGRHASNIMNENGWKSIIVNKSGADTVIGANHVASAKADGHTLLVSGQNLVANLAFPTSSPGIEYDQDSFKPIVSLGKNSLVLAVANNSSINSYEEFKDYVKKNPNKFKVAFWNLNTGKFFLEWAKVEGLPIPTIVNYKGSAPQIVDIIGGHVEFGFDSFANTQAYYAENHLKIIATFDEYGIKQLKDINKNSNAVNIAKKHPELEFNIMYGLFAPKGTDEKTIKAINEIVNKGLKEKKYQEIFTKAGISDFGGSTEKLDTQYKKLQSIFKKVAKNSD
jgi:tripartite-type tricarboxylate transporter receptor subunit TctC